MKIFILITLFLSLAACSQRQVYEAVQTNQKNQCDQLSGHEREKCLQQLAPNYDEYAREREDLLKK